MTSREKMRLALNHKTGPVPFDIGGFPTTGIHISVLEKLREYYGLEKRPVRVAEPYQLLGEIEDDLKQVIGVDTTKVWGKKTVYGFTDEGEKEWRTPWGQVVLVPEGFVTTKDEEGREYIYACSDTNYPPAAVLPNGFYSFDSIIRGHDFDEDNPRVEDNLEEYGEVSEDWLEDIRMKAKEAAETDYAVVANFGGTGIGDISDVPGPSLKQPKGLRDIEEWYIATVANQDYLHKIFAAQTEIAIKNFERIKEVAGDAIQAVYICGHDFGTQNAPFCSREHFRELYMPYYKIINGWIHKNTSWKTFKHSCGSIMPLIPELIESGFDILNPVQWSARDMDARTLKKEFGNEIIFWGGGVNTQTTLPFGTPEEVRREVLESCEIFAENGGFVFNTIHNIQALTPVENLVALIDAVKEFNG
jgi:hypothetical protein